MFFFFFIEMNHGMKYQLILLKKTQLYRKKSQFHYLAIVLPICPNKMLFSNIKDAIRLFKSLKLLLKL